MLKKNAAFIYMAIFTIALLIIHQFVFLYGDDYYYGAISNMGMGEFFHSHVQHYLTVNGRALVHFIVTLFLKFDIYAWRLVNPFIILGLCILTAKLVCSESDSFKSDSYSYNSPFTVAFLYAAGLFSLLKVTMTSESVYWLDGSFNYLIPMLLVFLVYAIFKAVHKNTNRKFNALLLLLSFIGGATMEQTGLMLIGLLFAEIIIKLAFSGTKPLKIHIYSLAASVSGYMTVVFAPGTFLRHYNENVASSFSPDSLSPMTNWLIFSDSMVFYHIIISVLCFFICLIFALNERASKRTFVMLAAIILMFLTAADSAYLIGYQLKLWRFYSLFSSNALMGLFHLATVFACLILFFIKTSEHIPVLFLSAGLGAHYMMIASPMFRERTMLITAIAFFVPICRMLIYIFNYEKAKPLAVIFTVFISGGAVFSLHNYALGYYSNYAVNMENLQIIKQAQIDNSVDSIKLKRMIDDNYAHTPLYTSNYHIEYLKKYYGLEDGLIVSVELASNEPLNRIFLGDKEVILNVNPPVIEEIFLVPIGETAKDFGYSVSFDERTKTVTMDYVIQEKTNRLTMVIGSNIIFVNGEERILGEAVQQIGFRTMLPAELFGEILGYTVKIHENSTGGLDLFFEKITD